MLKVGKTQTLYINRYTPQGAYLVEDYIPKPEKIEEVVNEEKRLEENEEELLEDKNNEKSDFEEEEDITEEEEEKDKVEEVLLPNRYITDEMTEGSSVEVFIYFDSEDRIVATTDKPYVMVGEVALLEVIDSCNFGLFLDWGLPKDLILPFSNQTFRPRVGDWCVVYVYIDDRTGRIVATLKLNQFINNSEIRDLEIGQQVSIVLAEENRYGFRCIIDNRHWGMIYNNQIFKPVRMGDLMKAYVVKITEDNRIDLSLQAIGRGQLDESSKKIMNLLNQNEGVLNLGDKSSPEKIYEETQMSKKMFKRGIGALYKAGKIRLSAEKIELV